MEVDPSFEWLVLGVKAWNWIFSDTMVIDVPIPVVPGRARGGSFRGEGTYKPISQRKNLSIECTQGDQPVRCPNRILVCTSLQTFRLVVFWWWLVLFPWWGCDVVWCHVVCFEVTNDRQCGWLRDVMLCDVMSCDVMWCHVMSCQSCHVAWCDVIQWDGMGWDVMWCDGMWLWDVLNWEMMCCELQRAHVTVLRLRTTKYVSALQKVLLRYYSVLVLLWCYYEEKNTLQKSRVSCVTTTERERRSSILFCIPHVGLRND